MCEQNSIQTDNLNIDSAQSQNTSEFSKNKMYICDMGKLDYAEALTLQERVQKLVIKGTLCDTFLLVEHSAVLTMGRRSSLDNILLNSDELKRQGVSVYDVSRGGDVTYHGPGQIVGYPIMDLNRYDKDIKAFIQRLQSVFIKLLAKNYGIYAETDDSKYTGVWVNSSKITAIGIAVNHWVTMHGFAFNVNTNLEHFKWIVPCGITDRSVTSLSKLLGVASVDFDVVKNELVKYFIDEFKVQANKITLDRLKKIVALSEEI